MKSIVIVGGGSSGWTAAAYLNGALNNQGKEHKVSITLVESPDIPRISVGEATVLTIRHTLAVIGINEMDFLKATDGSFKQAIKYANWVKNDNTHYYHPFNRFSPKPIDHLAQQWLASDRSISFVDSCSAQAKICELGLAPKPINNDVISGEQFSSAFHMNAQKFADFLRDFSVERGVKHVLASVKDASIDDKNYIKHIETDTAGKIESDLFIDCTGFRAMLIEQKLGVEWEDFSQYLLCNRAIAMHVPYESHYPGMVRPYTTATALSNGWTWDIPMLHQRSIGYVHSSDYISEEDAEKELRAYQGGDTNDCPARTIYFKVGRRRQHWKGNCIAIGLAGGFIEPLESTGLYLSDLGAVMLAEHFPWNESHMEDMAFRYNRILSNRYYEVLDFINMHYCLTQRDDTAFWREVQKPERINDRLKAKLDFWKMKPPSASDFEDQFLPGMNQSHFPIHKTGGDTRPAVDDAGIWNHHNYMFVMYSMGFENQSDLFKYDNPPAAQIHPVVQRRLQMAKTKFPTHEQWLKANLNMPDYPVSNPPTGWT